VRSIEFVIRVGAGTEAVGLVGFVKYNIQGVFLKCAEILPTTLFDNVED
jgi:hypothetical protein